jgi:cell fate (sporulation/competence/biofilm development) regulator YlbF (YheA/YmcA/DUF963 family)
MNENIFAKARELGELIKESDAFTGMRRAEELANANAELVAFSGEYEQLRNQMQEMTVMDEPDYDEIGAVSKQMDELQAKMMRNDDMKELQTSRNEFTQLMNLVNRELQGVLSPETLDEGCSGSCSSCAGCH